jgi:hypothetical protein
MSLRIARSINWAHQLVNRDISAVVQTAKKLALLAETLKRRSGEVVATEQRTAVTLAQDVIAVRSDANHVLEATHAEIDIG